MDGTAWIRELVPILAVEMSGQLDGWSWLQYLNVCVDGQSPETVIAEDGYNDWAVTRPTSQGGAGFDSQWDPISLARSRAIEAANDNDRNMWAIGTPSTLRTMAMPFNGSCTPRTMTKWPPSFKGSRNHLAGQRGSYYSRKRPRFSNWS